jgi:hypothetical protein
MRAVWLALETYKEFIINSLDLISFLLVTPEIIRRTVPAMSKTVHYIIVSALLLLMILWPVSYVIGPTPLLDTIIGQSLFRLSLFWVIFFAWLFGSLYLMIRLSDKINAVFDVWLAHHALLMGVLIFMLCRVFAFTMAAHDLVPGENDLIGIHRVHTTQ